MIILVGPSASGKTEIAKYLKQAHNLKKAITHTSRSPRKGEVNGVDYFFVSQEEFDKLYEEGALLEKVIYNGNRYGCSKKQIAKDKCLIVEPKGLNTFRSLNDSTIVTFFLDSSEETRRKRMINRGDDLEAIKARLSLDKEAFSKKEVGETDFLINTDNESIEDLGEKIYSLYLDKLNRV